MDPLEWLARLADHIPDPAAVAPTSSPTTFLLVAACASAIPTWGALRLEPAATLREE